MFENKNIKPMLLKEIEKPFNDENYLYEIKFDGYRAIIYVSSDEFVIMSRNGVNITEEYPELASIKRIVGKKKVIFDGEIVAMENGKPSFQKLISKNRGNVVFIAFDILYQNDSLIDRTLVERKKVLNDYKDTSVFIKSVFFSDGKKLFANTKKLKLEGIVAKEKNSIYIPNKRVDFWLKIKNVKEDYFYVHGFILNSSKYSLLLGEYKNNKFMYVGKVSIMENNPLVKTLLNEQHCHNLFSNYIGDATFIKPIHKVLVSYLEKSDKGILRQPVLRK